MSNYRIVEINRRRFLKVLSGAGLLFLPGMAHAGKGEIESKIIEMAKSLSKSKNVQRMGGIYLSQFPDEINPLEHVKFVEKRILLITGDVFINMDSVIHLVIRNDFKDAMTTDINGWQLSSTEAHMYALSALLA